MSLKKTTIKNSVFSVGAFLWPLMLSFFITPIIVKTLGSDEYGILALVTSFVGFFAVLDFGVAPSLVKYVSEFAAKGKLKSLNKTFSASLLFYVTIGLVGAVIILVGSYFFIDVLLQNSSLDRGLVQTAFAIAAIGFVVNMVLAAYGAVPNALQRLDITSGVGIVISTVSSLGSALLVMMGYGVVALVAFGVTTSLAGLVTYFIVDRRLLPELKITLRLSKLDFQHIFRFSGYASLATLSGMVISQFDRILLGAQLGPSAVTYYVVPGNLTIKILGLVLAAANVMFPLTSSLLATEQYEKLRHVYHRATRVIIAMLVVIIPPAIIMANKFLLYWLGPDFAKNSTLVLQVLLVTYGVSSLHAIPFLSAFGAGKPKYNAIYSLIVAIFNVIFMFILIPRYGINGAAFAYLIAVLPTLLFIPFVEKNVLNIREGSFWKSVIWRAVIMLLIVTSVGLVVNLAIQSLLGVVIGYVITLAVSGMIIVYAKVLEPEDLTLIFGFITKLGKKAGVSK